MSVPVPNRPADAPLLWPRARKTLLVPAVLKFTPADFVVREALPFAPSGDGEHCYVLLEKTGLATPELARLLADAHGIDLVEVGYAGMKDKQAVTSQWFSLRGVPELDDTVRELPGVRVLEESRHTQKLRKGQLALNAFEIVLRDMTPDGLERLLAEGRLEDLRDVGAPNYFGSQRFGWDNVAQATAWLARRRRTRTSKFKQGLYLSVLRSYLFNEVLGARVLAGNWREPIDGDVTLEGVPKGPLWGRGRSASAGEAALIEAAALERHQAVLEGLEYAGLKQDRRSFVLAASEFRWQQEDGRLRLTFSLGAGGYATSFLGELFELRTPPHGPNRSFESQAEGASR